MEPNKDLMGLMGDLDTIDLENFDPFKVPEKKDEPEKKQEPEGPSMEDLVAQVRSLKAEFEKTQATPPPKPEPEKPPAPEFTAPSDEEISTLLESGKTLEAMRAIQKQYAVNNFLPAIKEITSTIKTSGDKHSADSGKALTMLAARTNQDRVNSIPQAQAFRQEIYESFRGASPDAILTPGVIDNVIFQVIGQKALAGEFVPGRGPSGVPAGDNGPDNSSEGEVTDQMKEIFRKITGSPGDADVINVLRRPHAISLGRGEG
jgi:hypothetical protein